MSSLNTSTVYMGSNRYFHAIKVTDKHVLTCGKYDSCSRNLVNYCWYSKEKIKSANHYLENF